MASECVRDLGVDQVRGVQLLLAERSSRRAGASDSLALSTTGTVHEWGPGISGELGDGSEAAALEPQLVAPPGPQEMLTGSARHHRGLGAS